jgi:hypothetical protein
VAALVALPTAAADATKRRIMGLPPAPGGARGGGGAREGSGDKERWWGDGRRWFERRQ